MRARLVLEEGVVETCRPHVPTYRVVAAVRLSVSSGIRVFGATAAATSTSSAIWIAFSAAPLRRLSQATKSASPFAAAGRGGCGRRARRRCRRRRPRGREVLERAPSGAAASSSRARSGESGSSVSTQTASAWPTITGTRTQVALTAARAARGSCASPRGASTPRRTPRRRSPSPSRGRARPAARRAAAPSAARRRRTPTGRSRRARARGRPRRAAASARSVSGIAQQFGLATMPSCSSARSPFTSGTTSGTPSSSRYAADLSTQTAPPRTACGTSSRLALRADGEEADVEVARGERLGRRLLDRRRPPISRAGRARGREQRARRRSRARRAARRDAADRARRADDADPRHAGAPPPARRARTRSCSARTARRRPRRCARGRRS